ncbi:hypothetical protein FB559_3304 [Actinoallomurus bryophytorum]|uniref:Uncharacterized protein n=1 Tax=Actinoallomurus bryophytorum TaxID=1490222 RepID=A0A543CKT0_9ACTN|nr:hypothetical protein FB559_3304 [Actinoallomurus bryophytorum]
MGEAALMELCTLRDKVRLADFGDYLGRKVSFQPMPH